MDSPDFPLRHPEWSRSAVLYQLNTRQHTPEGTLRAAEAHLPRIQALGATVIWLMPIHPIGEKNRKGSLGSPYAICDYRAVHPDLGTLDDLRHFVRTAHGLGLRVILDWVANHTAWDHPWTTEHPEWYARDYKGDFRPTPWWDWSDIIELDYRQPDLRDAMADAMAYWVREADIDGFRCDVAGFVPTGFWEDVRRQLDAIRPVFLLAEWESRDLHAAAFDATYAWTWSDAVEQIAAGTAEVDALAVYYSWNEKAYPADAMRMVHVSNHDKNAWEGTMFERFGDALAAVIVLSVLGEGIPLVYGGQEAGNDRRLAFFEKDEIAWQEHWVGDLYQRLFALKHVHASLWNAPWGARMIRVPNDAERFVLSFVRPTETASVFVVLNLSPQPHTVTFREADLYTGAYTEFDTEQPVELAADLCLDLAPWAYRVFVR